MDDKPQDDPRNLDELRRLLLGAELDQLEKLTRTVEIPENFSSAVGDILPRAIIESSQRGEQLSEAMVPTVEEIVRLSIKNDISKFADALFPVIGPAIRKSITETIRQMLQSFNQTLEQSFSWQGVKWRLESMRTGIPISQIALLHGLVYRVEQVFLIHRKTGLLLQHIEQDGIQNQNADMVSSMLSAINDFAGDSFELEKNRALGSIEVGDLSIWIEQGPDAVVAVAIRGEAPNTVRTVLQVALEKLQLDYTEDLVDFDGDTSGFESSRDILTDCMLAQYQSAKSNKSLKAVIVWFAIGVGLLYWSGTQLYKSMQLQEYVTSLEQEPGYVITNVERAGGDIHVKGLRDPLSRDPVEILAASAMNAGEVIHDFEPYQSLQGDFVAKRAAKILHPPATVKLLIIDDALKIEGVASQEWRARLDALALTIPGIYTYDATGLKNRFSPALLNPPAGISMQLRAGVLYVEGRAENDWIESLVPAILAHEDITRVDTSSLVNLTEVALFNDIALLEQKMVFFDAATSSNSGDMDTSQISPRVKNIIKRARKLSKTVIIMVKGSTDSLGSYEGNLQLSLERAGNVANNLYLAGISPEYIEIQGLENPVDKERSEEERRFNRRVSFEVVIE